MNTTSVSSNSGVATALTVYGIETLTHAESKITTVATALTVYGIETGMCDTTY